MPSRSGVSGVSSVAGEGLGNESAVAPLPFLKWAGGKRVLLGEILPLVPGDYRAYHEPFVGAGAVLFAQLRSSLRYANDFNAELISAYEAIRDDVDAVLRELRGHVDSERHYLEVRSWDRDAQFLERSPASRAARLIYLNKCGFNGLYRVNRKGYFNVPYGKRANPDFFNEPNLRAVSAFLNQRAPHGELLTTLSSDDFVSAMRRAEPGDFMYCDPPYDPLSSTSGFTGYSHEGFNRDDQRELRDEIVRLTSCGVRVLLSNSDTPYIRDLYRDQRIFSIRTLQVRRAIAAKSASRQRVGEVLVTNYGEMAIS